MEPKIIFQDNDLLILDKPSGLTVNISDTTHAEKTVQDWVNTTFPFIQNQDGVDKTGDFYMRSGIVHRLDKETSGILLVTKNSRAFEHLQKQFKERLVSKTYLALAHGEIKPQQGEINVPVGRLEYNRKRFGIVAGGRESLTYYSVLQLKAYGIGKKKEILSLVELYPKTGRTHQIRVHLKYINHPIFSDFLYAGRKTSREDRKKLGRVFLHAAKITFTHPIIQKRLEFVSPLPNELQFFLSTMKEMYP